MPAPMAPGTIPGAQALDGPPPSPADTGLNPGVSLPPGTSLGGIVPPIPANQVPPEVLTGVIQTGDKMAQALDAFSQALPDLAADFAMVKQMLTLVMSKVQQAGGGPIAPNAPGPNFPGGGFDRGGMPLASGGLG